MLGFELELGLRLGLGLSLGKICCCKKCDYTTVTIFDQSGVFDGKIVSKGKIPSTEKHLLLSFNAIL